MSQPTKQVAVRLSLDLHAKIVATAAENNRSGHAEMLHRLEASFNDPAPAGHTMVEAAELTEVFTTCFTKLEERVAAMLESRGGMGQGFDFLGQPGISSPTGRLSESQPELQDLPPVSGMSTLAASVRAMGCMCRGGMAGVANFGGYHSGGFCGLPADELPQILERGERVAPTGECKFQSTITVLNPAPLPFTGQTWVITGSLETMTRDRAREIIMQLGGIVAGSVDQKTHAVVWGPGAGSKKTRAEELGVQRYTERRFIELIRSHGVDMPLPPADGSWTLNTGSCPVSQLATPETRVEVERRDGQADVGCAGNFSWQHDTTRLPYKDPKEIYAWRLAR